MGDRECVELLQWALPRLGKRWEGFRNVRGQVCKRIARRAAELHLPDAAAYRAFLEAHAEEWPVLDELSRVTISRFCRDRGVFDRMRDELLPNLAALAIARGDRSLRAWSAGCASGEEAYSLAMTWRFAVAPRYGDLSLEIVGTDIDDEVLARARRGRYEVGSLRELPPEWREAGLRSEDGFACVREDLRRGIWFSRQDIRRETPGEDFHLVLCRNLVFTYFGETLQREIATRIAGAMAPDGVLLLGSHERLPSGVEELAPLGPGFPGYRRVSSRLDLVRG